MDGLIARYDSVRDSDLRLCAHRGVAYQRRMADGRVAYNDGYLARCDAYDGTPIAEAVNTGRCAMLQRYLPAGASVLDIGAGSGAFVLAAVAVGFAAKGHDVIPKTMKRLTVQGLQAPCAPQDFEAVTLWDTIEHMEDAELILRNVRKGAHLFASIPVMADLQKIRESKHYRPGEHLYYWTAAGFIAWMALYGFRLLEASPHEVEAGREDIGAFAFCRDLPDYHDHVLAYEQLHASGHYGDSATELHLGTVAKVVRELKPRSILDYGCGRSDLVAHFWLDGQRRIERYDPAIPRFQEMSREQVDLSLVCDVMEHIPMASVDRVLTHVRAKSPQAFFTISTRPARAKLPDGRNAHVTLLTRSEWTRWIASYYGDTLEFASPWDHMLLLLAGSGLMSEVAADVRQYVNA